MPNENYKPVVGVGLRHSHYEQALGSPANLDFVEVHTENFYASGGATQAVLERARELYEVSFHCTSLGLGSAVGLSDPALARLAELVNHFDPVLVSDHLSFAWATLGSKKVHLGELFPIERNAQSLQVVVDNVDRVQQMLGRSMLIENVSSYAGGLRHQLSEPEFLSQLVEATGCRLLLDINNLTVNAHNEKWDDAESMSIAWMQHLPKAAVGEIHLAGYTPVADSEIAIDDHGQPVSELGWRIYRAALRHFGLVPTLIEWDSQLPDWSVLLEQADIARCIGDEIAAERSGSAFSSARADSQSNALESD